MLTAVVWLIESMVNALYASIMNLVKGVVIEMLEVVNNIIVQKQNLQIGRQLGIDPSHSQLAKDDFEHPLHSLASELASQAVIGVGKHIRDLLKEEEKSDDVSGILLYNEALKYMQHPAYCDWADAVAIKWIQENPHRIEERHAKDAAFQIATESGIWVKAQVKDIRALYNSVLVTISDLRNKFEELQQTVADFLDEIERYFQMTKRQLKKEVEEIGEKIDQQMKDYRKYLNDLMEEGKKWRDKLMKDGLSSLSPEEKYNFNIWANNSENKTSEILAELKKEYPTELEKQEIGLLENQVLSYNELVIKAKEDFLNNDSNFAGKLYQYCLNDTKDEQYKKFGNLMANYRNVLQQEIDTETTYLAQSAKEHLSQSRNA